METLFEKFRRKLALTSLEFSRSLMDEINWEARLIGIKGARGVGKTTMLLQFIKKFLPDDNSVLYTSLDDIWFSENSIVSLADDFVKKGGKHLFLDEVHKYSGWSRELKNIYDDHPNLQVVFTGSSLLEILNARADLSRRAIVYKMQGLSFREYLNYTLSTRLSAISLDTILEEPNSVVDEVITLVKPLQHFQQYLEAGYYPFFKEIPSLFYHRIEEIINMIIDVELPLLRGVDIGFSSKLKQLLLIISESAPFTPNVKKLSERIGINRNTLVHYFHFLTEAGLLYNLYKQATSVTRMQKPDKVMLENSNLAYAINTSKPEIGTVRETFFANQLHYKHNLSYPPNGDFLVDDQFLVEVGGKGKTMKQLKDWPEDRAFLAVDDIEYGYMKRIPLWLFGFLY